MSHLAKIVNLILLLVPLCSPASDCMMALYLQAFYEYTQSPRFDRIQREQRNVRHLADGEIFSIQNLDDVRNWAIAERGQVLFHSPHNHTAIANHQSIPESSPETYFLYSTEQLEALYHNPSLRRSGTHIGSGRLCSSTVFNAPACSPRGTAYAYTEALDSDVLNKGPLEQFVVVLDLVSRKIKKRFSINPILLDLVKNSDLLFSRRDLAFDPIPEAESFFGRKVQLGFLDEQTLILRVPFQSFDVVAEFNFVEERLLKHWLVRVSDPRKFDELNVHTNWILDDEMLLIPNVAWNRLPATGKAAQGFYATLINITSGRTKEFLFEESPRQLLLSTDSHQLIAVYADRVEIFNNYKEDNKVVIKSQVDDIYFARSNAGAWLAYYGWIEKTQSRAVGLINLSSEEQLHYALPQMPPHALGRGFYLRPSNFPDWELIQFSNHSASTPGGVSATIRRWQFSEHAFRAGEDFEGFPFGIEALDYGAFDPTLAVQTTDNRLFVLREPHDDEDTMGNRRIDVSPSIQPSGFDIRFSGTGGRATPNSPPGRTPVPVGSSPASKEESGDWFHIP